MRLIRAIYASKKSENLNLTDIEDILISSRRNNAKDEITGVLFFSHDYFLQCLEGKRSRVNALYNRIIDDDRHSKPYLIDYSEISERAFSNWSMGYIPDMQKCRDMMLRFSHSSTFEPEEISAVSAFKLLKALSEYAER